MVPAFVLEEPGFGFALVSLTTRVCFDTETGFFDFVFFADFLAGFFVAFFAAGFLAAFFAVFFAFFAAGLLFDRFFEALAARGDTFFAFFFFEGFFLKATTNSFMAQTNCLD